MQTKPTISIHVKDVPSQTTANTVAETVSTLAIKLVFAAPMS